MRFRCNKLRHEMWNLSLRRFLKSQLPGTQKAFNYTTCIEELLRDTILVQVPLPRNLPRWDVSKYNSNFNQLLVQVQVLVKVQHVQNRCSDYPEMSWLLVMLRTFFTCKLQRLQSMLSQTSAGSFTQQARRLRATVQVALSVCFRALERVNTHSTSSTLLRKKYSTSTGTQYLYKYIVLVQYGTVPLQFVLPESWKRVLVPVLVTSDTTVESALGKDVVAMRLFYSVVRFTPFSIARPLEVIVRPIY